jgi:uncharacterized membrane-anchored protein
MEMNSTKTLTLIGLMASALVSSALAQSKPPLSDAEFERSLHYKQGQIKILSGAVEFQIPKGFRFLEAKDAQRVLTDAWGNPPDDTTLGLIFPANLGPFDRTSWAVEVSYDEDGYVSDKDAASTNYTDLLKQMQDSANESNDQRQKDGYETIKLIGWAVPPRYDSGSHKMYWAKELEFGKDPNHTLNYNVRVLGRRGVLNLNAIAGMNQLPIIQKDMEQVIQFASFSNGNRYQDYQPGSDKLAEYGLAALVAGGIAAKTGLLAKILLVLLGLKKFAVVLVLGAVALVRRLFSGKRSAV